MEKIRGNLALIVPALLILAVAISFRLLALERIPAINGDEAFTSVQMREMVRGNPVTLWVPTQRLLSPIYASWVLLTETAAARFSESSLLTVRLPAAIAGVLLLFLTFFLMQQTFGKQVALLTTLFVACSPMAIAYSRSAVEQCLMGIVGIVPIYFALENRWKSAFFAYLIAILAHPVNVFLAPMIVFPLWRRSLTRTMLPLFGLAVLFLLWTLPAEYGYLNLISVFRFLLSDPWMGIQSFGVFLLYLLRLLSGTTAYEYFAVPPGDTITLLLDLFFGVGGLTLLVWGGRNLYRDKKHRKLRYLAGVLTSIFLFFIVAGPKALAPGLSRQANFLPVPLALLAALLLTSSPVFKRKAWISWTLVFVFCGASLSYFWLSYFRAIETTGGGFTHPTYITGPVEPKADAFRWIRTRAAKATLLAEDWWIYWPLKYLALDLPQYEVQWLSAKTTAADFERLFAEGGYAVGFPGGKVENYLKDRYAREKLLVYQPPSYSSGRKLTVWVKP